VLNLLKPMFLLGILLMAIAFESTLAPTINNDVIPHLDKLVHFFVFGIVAWLLAIVLSTCFTSLGSGFFLVFTTLMLVLLLGSVDEWIQSFTASRHAEVNDVLADIAGGLVFLLVYVQFNGDVLSLKKRLFSGGE